MQIARRTLHRHLAAKGLSYKQVVDETRSAFARQLLAYTRLGAGEVGMIVGYPDPSHTLRCTIPALDSNSAELGTVKTSNTVRKKVGQALLPVWPARGPFPDELQFPRNRILHRKVARHAALRLGRTER